MEYELRSGSHEHPNNPAKKICLYFVHVFKVKVLRHCTNCHARRSKCRCIRPSVALEQIFLLEERKQLASLTGSSTTPTYAHEVYYITDADAENSLTLELPLYHFQEDQDTSPKSVTVFSKKKNTFSLGSKVERRYETKPYSSTSKAEYSLCHINTDYELSFDECQRMYNFGYAQPSKVKANGRLKARSLAQIENNAMYNYYGRNAHTLKTPSIQSRAIVPSIRSNRNYRSNTSSSQVNVLSNRTTRFSCRSNASDCTISSIDNQSGSFCGSINDMQSRYLENGNYVKTSIPEDEALDVLSELLHLRSDSFTETDYLPSPSNSASYKYSLYA